MTQLLPASDAFTEEATHYGAKLAGYLRLRPWTSDAATGYAIPTAVGHLHSGYFNFSGGSLDSSVTTHAAFTSAATPGSAAHFCGALWRPYFAARCTVTLAALLLVGTGTYNDTFRYVGVTVRNTGGTFDDTAGIESITSGSGYWFLLVDDASHGGARWLLLRVNTGTITVLAQSALFALSPGQATHLFTISLDVTNVSGNVQLTATYQLTKQTEPINPFGGPVVDSSGSKLTGAGRCGFGMSRERVQSGPTIRSCTLAEYFQIFDSDSGTYALSDEWGRVALTGCTQVSGELNGKNGRMLSSMWGNDVAGIGINKAKRDAGNDRLTFDAVGLYAMFSQRAASSEAVQWRSVIVNIETSANPRYVGIQLRGSNLHDALTRACYQAQVFLTSTGDFECRLYDQRIGYTLLASVAGVAVSADHDILLEAFIENVGGTDALTGEVHISVSIDGSVVTGWIGAPAGVEIQATGLIIDRRSSRILSGFMEGIEVALQTSTEPVHVDEWMELSSPVAEDDESAQDSIAVSSETDGITGTLVLPVDWDVGFSKRAPRARHVMGSRHVGRIQLAHRARRRWRVRSKTAKASEKSALLAFYDAHKGTQVPFSWTEPRRGETVAVAFVDKGLGTTLRAPAVQDFSFELEERFAP